ncbi:hypothetical protein HKX48_006089 [Thoreauomyces humboldtii]|nr:hypothetical protein HKX48_006089 [Thoreauomyces humboldtii]
MDHPLSLSPRGATTSSYDFREFMGVKAMSAEEAEVVALQRQVDEAAALAVKQKQTQITTAKREVKRKEARIICANPERFSHPDPADWIPPKAKLSGTLEERLSQEIQAFAAMMGPTQEEMDARYAVVDRFSAAVRAIRKRASVNVFGSLATGLLLPTSDMDLVIVEGDVKEDATKQVSVDGLSDFKHAFRRFAHHSAPFVFIKRARVPLLQFKDSRSGYPIDLCYNQFSGARGLDYMNKWLDELPPLKPLVLVLKQFFYVRDLNSGGNGSVSGWGLVCWLTGFLRIHRRICPARYAPGEDSANVGALFLDFLLVFGYGFDFDVHGLDPEAEDGAYLFPRASYRSPAPKGKSILHVRSPIDKMQNACATLYRLAEVVAHLKSSYEAIVEADKIGTETRAEPQSLLRHILNVPVEVLTTRPLYMAQRFPERKMPRPAYPLLTQPEPKQQQKLQHHNRFSNQGSSLQNSQYQYQNQLQPGKQQDPYRSPNYQSSSTQSQRRQSTLQSQSQDRYANQPSYRQSDSYHQSPLLSRDHQRDQHQPAHDQGALGKRKAESLHDQSPSNDKKKQKVTGMGFIATKKAEKDARLEREQAFNLPFPRSEPSSGSEGQKPRWFEDGEVPDTPEALGLLCDLTSEQPTTSPARRARPNKRIRDRIRAASIAATPV